MLFRYLKIIVLLGIANISFAAPKITIESVFIRTPGCLYSTICCDCKNNRKYKNSKTIVFEMEELLIVGNGSNKITGSTQLEKRMLLDLSETCNNREFCKFSLYSPEYHCNDVLSKAYKVEVEYSCSLSSGETEKETFTGVFKDKHSKFYISCIDSVDTTNEKRNYCSPSSSFKKIVCGTIIGAVANALSEHLFTEDNINLIFKAIKRD